MSKDQTACVFLRPVAMVVGMYFTPAELADFLRDADQQDADESDDQDQDSE